MVDAQLPPRLAQLLRSSGHDAVHVAELPGGETMPDDEIARLADDEERVVATKDKDFRDSHLLVGSPRRLLLVRTGNIGNPALLALFEANISLAARALQETSMVEMGASQITKR